MRLTKTQLTKIIRETLKEAEFHGETPAGQLYGTEKEDARFTQRLAVEKVLERARLDRDEMNLVFGMLDDRTDPADFYGSSAFEKLLGYFMDTEEMPYGVAKARTGMPDEWILDYLQDLGQSPQQPGMAAEQKNRKITQAELLKIIKEELEAVSEQDAQAMMVRGARGAGRDPFSVEKIRINPDGTFKARLKSAQLEKPLRVAGELDHNSLALLHQAGALEGDQGPQKGKPQSPAHAAMMEGIDKIKANYDGSPEGMPPAVEELEKLVNAYNHEELRGEITNIWERLMEWHQRTGRRLSMSTTTTFNSINTLVRQLAQ